MTVHIRQNRRIADMPPASLIVIERVCQMLSPFERAVDDCSGPGWLADPDDP